MHDESAPYSRRAILRLGLAGVTGTALRSAASAPGPDNGNARMGINLAGPADWMTELPFVDVFRVSRPWISQQKGAGWGEGPALEIDPHGWVRNLPPDVYAETMLCTVSGGHYPSGIYTVLYEGEGVLDFPRNVAVKDARPGRILIEVDGSKGGFSLRILATDPAQYVRNIRVIMPGFEPAWQDRPFHPDFLARWKGMACFRFMDWMHTNGSGIRTWADRPTLQHATFSKRGVALPWMIALCNRQHVAPWFCMPHLADDDYIRRFAQTVKETLDPTLKIYLEYSNEVWNGQFAQSRHAAEQGVRLGLGPGDRPWEAGWHYTAVRSMEIFALWESILGGHDRLVRVLPVQSGVGSVAEGVCGFRDTARHADALAVAPYMGYTVGRGKLADEALIGRMKDWSVDEMLDHFEATGFRDSLERMRKDKVSADKYGLRLIAYEGGQHMVAFVQDRDVLARLTSTMHAANRHPRMGALYRKYFEEWARIGGGVFAHFSSIGGWSNHGAWGAAEYYDSTPAEYPKLAAVQETAARWGQAARRVP